MPKVSFRMASASRESVFGVQTNTAWEDHRSDSRRGRPSGMLVLAASSKPAMDVTDELDRGFDLHLAVGEALHIDAERQAEAAAEGDESAGVGEALVVGRRQGVRGSDDFRTQPSGDVDTQPGHEVERCP